MLCLAFRFRRSRFHWSTSVGPDRRNLTNGPDRVALSFLSWPSKRESIPCRKSRLAKVSQAGYNLKGLNQVPSFSHLPLGWI